MAQINPCSSDFFDVTLNNNYRISNNFPNGVTWSNKTIRVANGATVIFDKSVTMTSCGVSMGGGSRIIVTGNNTVFNASATTIAACRDMWDRIQLENNARIIFENNTTIRDADIALVPTTSATMSFSSITQTTFDRNRIGIQIRNQQFNPVAFSRNTFVGGTLKNGNLADMGMEFLNCDYADIVNNTFRGLQAGIDLESSTINVGQCIFQNMVAAISVRPAGWGIRSRNSRLKVNRSCRFSGDASGGINSTGARRLEVNSCFFLNEAQFGVSTTGNTNVAEIWISNNIFALTQNGIRLQSAILHERSPFALGTYAQNRITTNTITINDGVNTADARIIDVRALILSNDKFPIWRNTINCQTRLTPTWGVLVTGAGDNFTVNKNTLSFNPNVTGFARPDILGIAVENVNGVDNRIDSNMVSAGVAPTGHTMLCGIHLVGSQNVGLCRNTVNQTQRGFHFGGTLDFCNFARNNIGTHAFGIECTDACNMDDQRWHENVWSTNPADYFQSGARYTGSANTPVTAPFTFFVDAGVVGHFPPNPMPQGWFFPQPSEGSTSPCVIEIANSTEGLLFSARDSSIALGLYQAQSEADWWDAQRELWAKIDRHTGGAPSGLAAQFYESQRYQSPGLFAAAERAFAKSFHFPEPDALAWATLSQTQKTLEASLEPVLDSIAANTEQVPLTLLAQKDSLTAQLVALNQSLANLQSGFRDFALQRLGMLAGTYQALPANRPHEQNLKTVLGVYLRHAGGQTIAEDDWALLRPIARQCPLKGGNAVHLAKVWLPLEESSFYMKESYQPEDCDIEPRGNAPGGTIPNLALWPNPVHNNLRISHTGGAVEWAILDAAGRLQKQGKSQTTSFDIPLGELRQGLYWLRVSDRAGHSETRKFVIVP